MRRLLLILLVSGCSPVYVMRAAYEQGKILAARRPIEIVIADSNTSSAEKQKLNLVLEARSFAKALGLEPGRSFTEFAKVDRDTLTWVLLASKADEFSLHTWWFPFVGTVPYKGFFEKPHAEQAAQALQRKGYETWIRGSDAFSTLGWFNDPILSTTLNNSVVTIVDTVIHESVHSTIWIADHVTFNESLANFVGGRGALRFFERKLELCASDDQACVAQAQEWLAECRESVGRRDELSVALDELHSQLSALYETAAPRSDKLTARRVIFENVIGPLRSKYPAMKILQSINNAEIMQLKLYMTGLDKFTRIFDNCAQSIACMMEQMRTLNENLKPGDDPFAEINGS